ncbi:hypothetical protein QOZ80_6AG0545360 [Eleusine coracana subsp. coracana]|nr:hypothetical protein QOZ80_6AG0545360 [Eleusine coracana subsp. coracana]
MISGVDVYNMSWKSPGLSFTGSQYMEIKFTGCDFDTYRFDVVNNSKALLCTVTCPSEGITKTVARKQCNGTGCCTYRFEGRDIFSSLKNLHLQFVRHNRSLKGGPDIQPPDRVSLWDRIDVDTSYMSLLWVVADQPNCVIAKKKTNYACVSEHSFCSDESASYLCGCEDGYFGNPYVPSGCFRDRGK